MSKDEVAFSAAAVGGGVQYNQPSGLPPQQGGYPQQVGYPPQQGGYAPQQGGYPPQQGGYPPQQAGYPPQQGGYPPQQGQVVIVQQGIPAGQQPNSYLAFSIITLICFNLIFGIIALICSIQSSDEAKRGDLQKAREKSKCALGWNVSALILWFLLIILVPVIWYFVIAAAVTTSFRVHG